MAELTLDDLARFTKERLPGDDDEYAQELLDAALAGARRYCGWPVSPVIEDDEVTVDGPGGRVLSLPTRNLLELSEVIENGVALDVTKLDVSRRKGTVEKYPYGWWTGRASGIAVTMTHGLTEAEAADWRRAVLRLADLMDRETARDDPSLKRKRVDDVEYEWFEQTISGDTRLSMLLAPFRILPSP